MFELNSSYSDVKKTKKENGKQVLFLDETIEEKCARAVSRKTPIYFILEREN